MNQGAPVAENTTFDADDIVKLEYPTSVWKRPSMYLGERGSQQSVATRELVDNSVHEKIRGFATKLRVVFAADGSITVQDDGRGLPVDTNTKTGLNGIVLTMATLHAGSNFSNSVAAGKAGAGLNGVGASVANALAKRFDAIVFKGGNRYELSFQDGFAGHFAGEGPDAPFTPGTDIVSTKDPRSTADKKVFKTGTLIRLWFNEERFPKDEAVDIDDLVARLQYTAYIVPGLHIEIVDENRTYEDGSVYHWEFHSDHGLPEMVESIATDAVLPGTDSKGNLFSEKGIQYLKTEAVYNEIAADEHGKVTDVKRTVTAELAFRYGTGYEKKLASFVNTIHTHLGGVHERAFEKALVKSFGDRMGSMRGVLTAKDEPPIIDDYFEGMTVALSVNVPEPQFVGQQKDKLSGPEVEKALTKAFTELLSGFVNAPANQKFLKPMFDKVVTAAKNRKAANEAKLAKRKSNQVSQAALPAKLADCDITGTDESELLICEGDSAAGTIKKARDATYQAVIPIRGKILNSLKASTTQIVNNKEITEIAKALGAGFGKDFDIEKIRYGKVLFAADADVDGLQINNLLYTVFNRLFRQMIEEGRVYQTVPPLYEITVGGGRNQEVIYVANDVELGHAMKKLEKSNKTFKVERNKGLGQMTPESFYNTVLDPEQRTLRRITLEDAAKAEAALMLTMGENSQERKDFMGDNFQVAIDSGLVEGFEEGND
jgi:DNA gyrase subunit B